MADHVVVVASGETERRSLPHLVSHLRKQGTSVDDVRIPPRNKALDVDVAEKIIKSIWYENLGEEPDKIVLLVDVDRKSPDQALRPMREELARRLPNEIEMKMQYAHAQRHLEAWYFADGGNLRSYLKRDLGRIDDSRPDEIENPKLHLRNILDQVYTARVSEEIARVLDAENISRRSPSFRGFLEALLNGVARA
ncbi:MAG: DUF4276 family protein [Gammaproteobacteria bacterium]|nr:DUF4276 family protein [Gammaproteobacteria bacterium]